MDNRNSLTPESLRQSATPVLAHSGRIGKVKIEHPSGPIKGAQSDSTEASKSKSLTQDHNYNELLGDGVDPMEGGARRKLTLIYTSVNLARDAIDPSKLGQKTSKNALDLSGYDVHELKRFHTLMLTTINYVRSMAQFAPSATTDPSKVLKFAPDVVRIYMDMRDFGNLNRSGCLHLPIFVTIFVFS